MYAPYGRDMYGRPLPPLPELRRVMNELAVPLEATGESPNTPPPWGRPTGRTGAQIVDETPEHLRSHINGMPGWHGGGLAFNDYGPGSERLGPDFRPNSSSQYMHVSDAAALGHEYTQRGFPDVIHAVNYAKPLDIAQRSFTQYKGYCFRAPNCSGTKIEARIKVPNSTGQGRWKWKTTVNVTAQKCLELHGRSFMALWAHEEEGTSHQCQPPGYYLSRLQEVQARIHEYESQGVFHRQPPAPALGGPALHHDVNAGEPSGVDGSGSGSAHGGAGYGGSSLDDSSIGGGSVGYSSQGSFSGSRASFGSRLSRSGSYGSLRSSKGKGPALLRNSSRDSIHRSDSRDWSSGGSRLSSGGDLRSSGEHAWSGTEYAFGLDEGLQAVEEVVPYAAGEEELDAESAFDGDALAAGGVGDVDAAEAAAGGEALEGTPAEHPAHL